MYNTEFTIQNLHIQYTIQCDRILIQIFADFNVYLTKKNLFSIVVVVVDVNVVVEKIFQQQQQNYLFTNKIQI